MARVSHAIGHATLSLPQWLTLSHAKSREMQNVFRHLRAGQPIEAVCSNAGGTIEH